MTSIKSCDRCIAVTKSGTRCKLRTCKTGPYCWIHTESLSHLRVLPSHVPNAGLGLYAMKRKAHNNEIVFKKDDKITDYKGRILTNAQYLPLTNAQTTYVIQTSNNKYINANRTNDPVGRYVNDCRGPHPVVNWRNNCNSRFACANGANQCSIRATKNIRQGNEILADYGNAYWT